jgi:alpha-tubulin suppressor-like RCC1 family protein
MAPSFARPLHHVGNPFRAGPAAGAIRLSLLLAIGACGDGSGPGETPAPLQFASLTVTRGASCGLTGDGSLYCWGDGRFGLLGSAPLPDQCGSAPCSTRPHRVHGDRTFTTVSANSSVFDNYACGLDPAGQPYCWGRMLVNADGSHDFGATPAALSSTAPLIALTTGRSHICGLTATHEAHCWGDFEAGVRGDPTIGFDTSYATFEPNVVGGGLTFTAVSAGAAGTCGLTTGGQGYCWGADNLGQLGDPAAPVQQQCGLGPAPCAPAPVPVAGGHAFTVLSGTGSHVCGLEAGGQLFCWGNDANRQTGTIAGAATTCAGGPCVTQPEPVQSNGVGFAAVSAGPASTCALDSVGEAYCWGDNAYGQLGNGGGQADIPVAVAGDVRFSRIAVAEDHTCALSLDGEAYCWGENGFGQLGSGTLTDSNEPVAVAGSTGD